MKKLALAVALLVVGATRCQAQWTMTGAGVIEQTGPDFTTEAQVQPDCGTGTRYICDINWVWQAHNWTLSGTAQSGNYIGQGAKVIDTSNTYEIAAFVEHDRLFQDWQMRVKVVHKDLSTGAYTELLNIAIGAATRQPGEQWLSFSSGYGGLGCNHYCTTYAFKYSADGVNWSTVSSWKYDRNGCNGGYPCGASMFILANLAQGQTNSLVDVDNWVTYETPGRVTPDLLLVNDNGATNFGSICDSDECATPGQVLFGNK